MTVNMRRSEENDKLNFNVNSRFLAESLKSKFHKIIFFIGAGVSYASGLPLGNELRDRILMKLYPEYPLWDHKKIFRKSFYPDYPKKREVTLEMILQQIRKRMGYEGIKMFFKSIINKRLKPTLSHEMIAHLFKNEYITSILTTNFDNLLEQAMNDININFKVVSKRDAIINDNTTRNFTVWKLHGDFEEPKSFAVTTEDVLHFPDNKKNVLKYIFQNYIIVFVGYSMRDPDVLELISEINPENKKYSYFWVNPTPLNHINQEIKDTINKFDLSENYIQVSSDDFFNDLNYFLCLKPPFIIWKANEAKILSGGLRGENDPWNRDCPSYTRIFGASPLQENYSEWEGATIELQKTLRNSIDLSSNCKGAILRIEIPPIDGKGIHGKKNGKVILNLITDKKDKIKLSELTCVKKGYLETWWPHDDRYKGIHPEFIINYENVKYFNGLKKICLELEIEHEVVMDVSKFLLYFF